MDRTVKVTIAGKEYELLFTLRALKEISKKFGGIEKLDNLDQSIFKPTELFDNLVWAFTLLANQHILLHNLKNENSQKSLVDEEEISLFITIHDIKDVVEALTDSLGLGTLRNVFSQVIIETAKNALAG